MVIPTNLNLSPPSPSFLSLLSPPLPFFSLLKLQPLRNRRRKRINQRSLRRSGVCRASFTEDAPFAIAIGACILSSAVFPYTGEESSEEEEEGGAVGTTDVRLAAMSVISFIPYFNWLSWVFAWLDTGDRRYAVYAIVYLAPYIRSNLSLSPDESWLPIASILLGIIHVQLEASIKNGDLDGFRLFNGAKSRLSSTIRRKEVHFKREESSHQEERDRDQMNLPSAQENSRDEIRNWKVPGKRFQDPEHGTESGDAEEGKRH